MKKLWYVAMALFLLAACEEDVCENVTCLNGGTCVDGLGTCECQPGYAGDSCEVYLLETFLGSFEADYGGCVNTAPEHRVGIEQVPGEESLRILNLGDYACPAGPLAVSATTTGSTITIDEQAIDCDDIVYTFSGSGQISGNVLHLDFSVRYDAGGFIRTDQCSATLTKE